MKKPDQPGKVIKCSDYDGEIKIQYVEILNTKIKPTF